MFASVLRLTGTSTARQVLKKRSPNGRSLASTSHPLRSVRPNEEPSEKWPQSGDSERPPLLDPLKHPDFFGVHKLFTVKDLFDARVHLGHKQGTLNLHMAPYVFGSRLGLLIIDLNQTMKRLQEALNIVAHIAYRGGVILFVNRSRQTGHMVEEAARDCGEYAHCRHFNPGTFNNSEQFFDAVTRLPDLVVFLNSHNNVFMEHVAVRDAAKLLIPCVGIVDTSCDPTLITYPVPGNDDTPCAIELYCKLFKQAVLSGKAKRKEFMEEFGTVPM